MSAADFVTGVERLLTRAHNLFPASSPNNPPLTPGVTTTPTLPSGESALADRASAAGLRYHQAHTQLQGLDAETTQITQQASTIGAQGRAGSGAILQQARTQAAALLPMANAPAGRQLLMATMDHNLAAMQGQIATTTTQYKTATARLTATAADYRQTAPHDEPNAADNDPSVPAKRDPTIRAVDWKPGDPLPPQPPLRGHPPDPTDTRIGDPRFGQWQNVPPPPPYTGTQPPPLRSEYRPYPDDSPLKVGPTTGMYTPGKTWIGDIDPPIAKAQEEYRFRLAGTEATTNTRMVFDNGQWHEQRWVQNVYEYQRNTSLVPGGNLGGLPPLQNIDRDWKPITLNQLGTISAANPTVTYYLPDGCGGTVNIIDTVPQGPTGMPPTPPIMTRPR